jgi:hypothetical protein
MPVRRGRFRIAFMHELRVTHEARLRYRQRVEANVANAAEAIRSSLSRAREVATDRVTNARALADKDAIFVIDDDDEVVQTVLCRYDYERGDRR